MQLSKSTLGNFRKCALCFWLDKNHKAPQARGIFSSLPNGVDGIIKGRLDSFRGSMPPELRADQLKDFQLFSDGALLNKRRQWNASDLFYTDGKGNKLVGGLDDILEHFGNGMVAPFDYKTKGSEPCQEDCEKYYQIDMDIYALLLSQKHSVADFGALAYFYPVPDENALIKWETRIFILGADPARGKALFEEALACLAGPMPKPSETCEYCKCEAGRLAILNGGTTAKRSKAAA